MFSRLKDARCVCRAVQVIVPSLNAGHQPTTDRTDASLTPPATAGFSGGGGAKSVRIIDKCCPSSHDSDRSAPGLRMPASSITNLSIRRPAVIVLLTDLQSRPPVQSHLRDDASKQRILSGDVALSQKVVAQSPNVSRLLAIPDVSLFISKAINRCSIDIIHHSSVKEKQK